MNERGKIYNRERATQVRDFSGLRWGNITPTDIDGFIDFHNKLFIYIELKYGDAKLPYGQKLALERQCNACRKGKIPTVVLIARHFDDGDINVAEAIVTEIYEKRWRLPKYQNKNVKETIDIIRKHYHITDKEEKEDDYDIRKGDFDIYERAD